MKKICAFILIIATVLSLASCGFLDELTAKTAKIQNFRIERVVYKTQDGEWTQETVSEMIDRYYYEQRRNVNVSVSVTLSFDSDFQYADITCSGGVSVMEFEAGNVVIAHTMSGTLGSTELKDGMVKAGTYTFDLGSDDFSFYATYGSKAVDREKLGFYVSVEAYKYYT